MSPEFNHEVEMMSEFVYDESDGDLRILFKHDYYSTDNACGRMLLESFIDSLIVESNRICLIIILDSAVKLFENSLKFNELVNKSPSTLISNESLSFYGISYEPQKSTIIKLDSEDIADTVINSFPNVLIE